ncbi:MAG: YD repeat-containing protein [Verrucomicrobiales bacterium]|jgi:YD repeat-containing protein
MPLGANFARTVSHPFLGQRYQVSDFHAVVVVWFQFDCNPSGDCDRSGHWLMHWLGLRGFAQLEAAATLPISFDYQECDAFGRMTGTTLADGSQTGTAYDAAGRVIGSLDPLSNLSTFEYDDAGRRTKTIDALLQEVTSSYDAKGNLLAAADARGFSTSFSYDIMNRMVTKLVDPVHPS